MGGVEDAAQAIAARRGSGGARLRELMTTIHRMNSERYVGDSKLHEMVEIAMEESWEVCVAHMERITETIGGVIARAPRQANSRCRCAAGGDVHLHRDDAVFSSADDRAMRRQAGTVARPDDRLCRGGCMLGTGFREQFTAIADAWALAQGIVDTVREPVLVLDKTCA
jgi:hypothetical protein